MTAGRLVLSRLVALCCSLGLLLAGSLLLGDSAQAAAVTYTVDSTADTNLTACDPATAGDCTLRGAINAANAHPGADTIDFNIPGAGVKTITSSASALPLITDPVTIDGYSQPGASANTQTLAQGDNAVLLIEVTGAQSTLGISGDATTGGSGTTIRGLVANGASNNDQIQIDASNVTIAGNFIGLDPTGATAKPSGSYGIRQESQHFGEVTNNNTIGGTADADRNVISGNPTGGIILSDGGPTVIRGNYLGTNVAGTAAIVTGDATGPKGVNVLGGAPFTVNSTSIVGNLISGNPGGGIAMNSGGLIQGNLIGTQRDGTSPLGNGNFGGIHLGLTDPVTVGGVGTANTIAFNANNGVAVGTNSSQKAILGNSIYSNGEDVGGLGISLRNTSTPLPNDAGDGDSVPGNLGQNYPVLSSASVSAGLAMVSGSLNSTASTTFHLEFFSNAACNTPSPVSGAPPSDFGEGQTFLGTASVTTDGGGNASFGPVSFAVPAGQAVITSTATDPSGNTSEFSQCLTATTAANTAPTANNDSYSANENQTLSVPAPGVLANDTDAENDPLTAVKVSDPAHGSVTLNSNGSFAYTPNANYSGSDSFTYRANDGTADSNTATVSLNVSAAARLTVSTSGSGAQTANGARAYVTGPGIDCSTGDHAVHNQCSTTVTDGTQITLTAHPAQGGGAFTGFTGGGCGAANPCTVTMDADKSVDARFAGPPSAIVTTPADGATYRTSTVVNANYSCSPGPDGGVLRSGTAGCSGPVPNGSQIDTTAGAHTFTVTATDTDGQTATTTSHYTVALPGPPSATVTTPADGASYFFGSAVNANYSCSPGTNGGALKPGTAGCSGTVPNGSPIDTLTSGTHTFTVTATDTDGQTTTTTHNYTLNYNQPITTPGRPQRPLGTVIVNPRVDIHVTGIEVTQGVQANTCNCAGTLPNRLDPFANTPGRATYEGVTMAAGKYTVVRVFAHFTPVDVPSATSLRGATARLRIFDSHEREISPELSPVISPSTLTRPDCPACVTESERTNLRAPYTFLVPWNDTYHRSLSFRATVSPPTGFGTPVLCGGCNANVFTLRGVPFATTAEVPIYPIPLTLGGVQTTKTPDQVFDSAATVLPVNVDVQPYGAALAVDGLPSVSAALAKRASDDGFDGSKYVVGVAPASFGFGGSTDTTKVLYGAAPPISYVADDNRPLTDAMHEIGHGLGLVHADTGTPPGTAGPHPDGTADCGGNSNQQVGEAWPPDNEGRIQGIGLDLRTWPWRTLVEHYPNPGDKYYDFMSYCPGAGTPPQQFEDDHWISVRNWSRLIAFHPPAQALPAAVAARAAAHATGGASLRVIATVDSAGKTSLFDVAVGERTFADPTAGSPYRIELRDAAGSTIASVVPATTSVHNDGQRPGLLLEATLPLAQSGTAVVVSAGGVELARRTRSAHAPTAAIISPRPRTRIGHSAQTLVRWRAHDADGDRLTTTVDYSADRGRHWIVVASTAGGDSARVPSRLLSASRNARLRIRVSDGFNVATATSGVLRAVGGRPVVRIIGGAPRGQMLADAMLLLRAEAFDDSGRQINGRNLAWYDGRRLLGHGMFLTARNLPVGKNGIRLVATDTLGRSTRALLPLKVLAPPPTFLVARAPGRVAPSARRVRIVVASSVPATLAIGGKHYAVTRKRRTITISIRRGRSILRLAYVLSGRGGALRGTYLALR